MATPRESNRQPRDPALKAIFSHPRMLADALRGYAVRPRGPLDPHTIAALNFNTLEKLPAEWITPDFRRRIGDQAWRVRFRWAPDWSDPGGYLLILVEFQSHRRSDMALRMASYAMRLYDELEATGVLRQRTPRPPIFPLVIYNGPGRWTAATTLDRLIAAPAQPPAASAHAEEAEIASQAARDLAAFQLSHAYFALAFHPYRKDDPHVDNAMSLQIGLENASTWDELRQLVDMLRRLPERRLVETMLEWALQRLNADNETAEEMKAMASLDHFYSQLDERAKGWRDQLFAEGVQQGRAEGVEMGRAMLRRQAGRRFGASAEPLYPLLDKVHSTATLEEIGDWVMADTIDQLIAKVKAAVADDRIH